MKKIIQMKVENKNLNNFSFIKKLILVLLKN